MAVQKVALGDLARVRRLAATGQARSIREHAGVTKAELARWVGCSDAAVSRWESSERRPTGRLAVAYLRALRSLESEPVISAPHHAGGV